MSDNEFAIYHTTVADVALRKSPCWHEMFSIRNIKKIMNHHDVLVSKGQDSLTPARFEMGTGIYINVSLPEESAQFLREG